MPVLACSPRDHEFRSPVRGDCRRLRAQSVGRSFVSGGGRGRGRGTQKWTYFPLPRGGLAVRTGALRGDV